jgi:hypothetical protein
LLRIRISLVNLVNQQNISLGEMMGSLFGFFAGIGLLFGAWEGSLEPWGFGVFIAAILLGIVLMPMTVGTFMTTIMFMAPLAAILALIRGNFESAGVAAGITVGAFITQILVGLIRGGSTY